MAEAYDRAIRDRLATINSMGASATDFARQGATMRRPVMPTGGESMRMPVYNGGPGVRYNGPRGNMDALLNFGKYLQSQGFRISENSHFNGGRRITGGHVKGSRHYSDHAIDVNYAPGTSRREQQAIDRIVGLAKYYGLRSIWRQKGHFNHAHFDF